MWTLAWFEGGESENKVDQGIIEKKVLERGRGRARVGGRREAGRFYRAAIVIRPL